MSFKFDVGDEVTSYCGSMKGKLTFINDRYNRCKVLFDNGLLRVYSKNAVEVGEISDKPHPKIKTGDIYSTNNYGKITIVEYISAHNVVISFEDGAKSTVQASSIRLGNVRHPSSGIIIGDSFTNGDGCDYKVVAYHNPLDVDIEWYDGVVTKRHIANGVKKGVIYYPNYKSVCGIGYFGIGNYISDRSGKTGNYNKRVYASWQRMIRRCYDEKEQKKPSCIAYVGVKVCEEWHCFQNFAEWASDKENKFIEGYDLDKDMFGDGWLYSPETCTLLPSEVNWFLSDNYSNKSSGLPDGVNIVKPKKGTNATVGYIARCHVDNVRQYLGFYKTPEEAAEVYKVAKESEAVRLATKFKSVLSPREYIKLMNFTLSDIHRKKDT